MGLAHGGNGGLETQLLSVQGDGEGTRAGDLDFAVGAHDVDEFAKFFGVAGDLDGFAASENLVAACTTSVTYQASGSFGANVVKGMDVFKLAGEPFSINLYACEGKAPSQTGKYDSVYTGIALVGTVKSALETTPYT